jgi:hypothetical protein
MLSFLLTRVDPGGGGGSGGFLPTTDWGACVQDVTNPDGTISKVATLGCIPIVLKNVISGLLLFAAVVAIIIVIISGYKFIMSRGDQKQVQGAKVSLTYAILGLIIILLSFFIINIIAYVTGAHCITMFGFANCQ